MPRSKNPPSLVWIYEEIFREHPHLKERVRCMRLPDQWTILQFQRQRCPVPMVLTDMETGAQEYRVPATCPACGAWPLVTLKAQRLPGTPSPRRKGTSTQKERQENAP